MPAGQRMLVTGAVGQVAQTLVPHLRARFGADNVIAAGHATAAPDALRQGGPFIRLDVTDAQAVRKAIKELKVDTIYHLAALLSATGEQDPERAWAVNVDGLKYVLDASREAGVKRIFWPSSIAVFGPTSPRRNTPQSTVLEPTTMYGVTKVAGELLCNYYFRKYGLDIRSLRYPGLVSHEAFSGGGTTDYSVEMFFEAKRRGRYTCFVRPDTMLPLMYMDDAIRATVEIMEVPGERLTVRTSYNLGALSFTAGELAEAVARRLPGFTVDFVPDFRQAIADSWPMSVDDEPARRDWGWREWFDLPALVETMVAGVERQLGAEPG